MELPNGGEADVIGNVFEQTIGTRNSTIVSFGAEGCSGARNVLRFTHKAVINDESQGGTFLPVRPGADLVVSRIVLSMEPARAQFHVCQPRVPGGIAEVATAVAATQQIDLQYGAIGPRQCA